MKKKNYNEIKNPIINSNGEKIFELFGDSKQLGSTKQHSVCYVIIPKDCSSDKHYHKKEEETYHIIKGTALININDKNELLKPGDTILIEPNDIHLITNHGDCDLEFLCICAPPWSINDIYHVK